jgi:hypothetical protein
MVFCSDRFGGSSGIDRGFVGTAVSGEITPLQLAPGEYECIFVVVGQLDSEPPLLLDSENRPFSVVQEPAILP